MKAVLGLVAVFFFLNYFLWLFISTGMYSLICISGRMVFTPPCFSLILSVLPPPFHRQETGNQVVNEPVSIYLSVGHVSVVQGTCLGTEYFTSSDGDRPCRFSRFPYEITFRPRSHILGHQGGLRGWVEMAETNWKGCDVREQPSYGLSNQPLLNSDYRATSRMNQRNEGKIVRPEN